jgi:aryl-alcohol dehydrogenase-like predicted oxidoreductase
MEVSRFMLGAGAIGDPARDDVEFAIRDKYLAAGGNAFDTARAYGGGEADVAIGRYLRSRNCRDGVYICMKGCMHDAGYAMFPTRVTRAHIKGDLELSLKAMRIERADFYLLHRDDISKGVEEIMPALDELVKEGKARAIGCSNWTAGRIAEANAFAEANGLTPFSVSQIFYSLAQTTAAQTKDLSHIMMNDVEYKWYLKTGFPLMAFGSQGRGYFHRRLNGLEQKPGTRLHYDFLPENHARAERLKALSEETGRSIASILSAYVRDSGLNTIVLNAFSSADQLSDALGALNFALTDEQIRFLRD